MRIALVGHGALGTLYGHAFSQLSEHQVIFVTNKTRAARLRSTPLRANRASFKYRIETAEDTAGPADLVIFAVKYHHLEQAVTDVKGHVGSETIFVSVMNGIDSEDYIASHFGKEHVLYTVALGMDAVREGHNTNYSTPGKLLLGRADAPAAHSPKPKLVEQDPDIRTFTDLCDAAGIRYEIQEDILRSLWSKFMLNIGINQVSAVLQTPYRPFQQPSHAQELMRTAMHETISVARSLDIPLYPEDIEQLIKVVKTLSPEGKTSMCQDIEAGRKTEVEMFAGKLIELADRLDVEVPVNRTLFALIKAKEEAARLLGNSEA